MGKKPTGTEKRDKVKNPGLRRDKFSKVKQEYHDLDYIHKLDAETAQWMNNFMEEDLGARLDHPGEKIYTEQEDKRACYQRNNQRNRDLYASSRATGKLLNASDATIETYLDSMMEQTYINPEDQWIDELDLKNAGKFVEDTKDDGDGSTDGSD